MRDTWSRVGREMGVSGMGPELFSCDGGRTVVVETRRLELLTLSLQRRCSTS